MARSDVTSEGQMAFWTLRYTLRACQDVALSGEGEGGVALDLPSFLRAHAHTILTTGKYLNAVMECAQASSLALSTFEASPLPSPLAQEKIRYDPQGSYASLITTAHARASSALMACMKSWSVPSLLPPSTLSSVPSALHSIPGGSLMALLKSVKHYFLFDQGNVHQEDKSHSFL